MTSISGPSMAEEEANSTLSNDDGSSGDESRMAGVGPSKKRRREKHQKISYVFLSHLYNINDQNSEFYTLGVKCARLAR